MSEDDGFRKIHDLGRVQVLLMTKCQVWPLNELLRKHGSKGLWLPLGLKCSSLFTLLGWLLLVLDAST